MPSNFYSEVVGRNGPHLHEILVHGVDDPTDSEWMRHVTDIRSYVSAGVTNLVVLVFTDGGVPNAKQRRLAEDISDRANPLGTDTFVVSGSKFVPLIRGVLSVWKMFATPASTFNVVNPVEAFQEYRQMANRPTPADVCSVIHTAQTQLGRVVNSAQYFLREADLQARNRSVDRVKV